MTHSACKGIVLVTISALAIDIVSGGAVEIANEVTDLLPPPDQQETASGCSNGEYYVEDPSHWLKNETNALIQFSQNFQCMNADCENYFGTTVTFTRETQACLSGELEVMSGLDAKFQKGIFATPGAKYKTLMRFNSKEVGPQIIRVALKIFEVGGFEELPSSVFPAGEHDPERATQDIIMEPVGATDATVAEQAAANTHSLVDSMGFASGVLAKFGITSRRLEEKESMRGDDPQSQQSRELLSSRKLLAHATTPVEYQMNVGARSANRFGTKSDPAIKFFMRRDALTVNCKDDAGADETAQYAACYGENGGIHTALDALATGDGGMEYEFYGQLQGCNDPIERGNISWSSTDIAKIATLKLTKAETRETCTQFSYCSWHSIEAHRGLGSLNRARRPIYYQAHMARQAEVATEANVFGTTTADAKVFAAPLVSIAVLVSWLY